MRKMMIAAAMMLLAAGCASDSKTEPVTVSQTPAAVRLSVEKAYPASTVKQVDKEVYKDGTIHYEVELVTQEGKSKELEVAADGEILSK